MQTSPKHWLDFVLWLPLKVFWEPFSKKRSHFWHWKRYEKRILFGKLVAGNPEAKTRRGSIWANLKQSNFGWQRIAILEPVTAQPYQIGFISKEDYGQYRELCSLVLNGPCAGLVGPEDVFFFAIGFSSGETIELKEPVIGTKKTLPKTVTLI